MARTKLKCAQFCWTLLQYWYYEHVGKPVPTLKRYGRDVYPLILKWGPSARAKDAKKQAGHSTVTFRLALESVTPDSFRCGPHRSSALCMEQRPVHVAEFLSLNRHIFVHGDQVRVFYLGERLSYQMLGQFQIPCPPPRPMAISDAEYEYWSAGYYDAQGIHRPFMPADTTPLRLVTTREIYEVYWSKASLGFLLDRVFRHRNSEYVNPASLREPSLLPAGLQYAPDYQGSIQTQSVIDDLSQYMSSCDIRYPGGDPVTIAPVERYLPLHATNDAWRDLATHEQGLVHGIQNYWYDEMEFCQRQRDWERRCRERCERRMAFYINAGDDLDGPCEPDVEDDSPPPTRFESEATGSFIYGSSSTQHSHDLGEDN